MSTKHKVTIIEKTKYFSKPKPTASQQHLSSVALAKED